MSSTAERLRATLLAHFGEDGKYPCALTHRVTPAGAYDQATGGATAGRAVDSPGWGRVGTYSDRLIDGQMVQRGDRLVTFVPCDLTLDVTIGATLIRDDESYRVINVKKRELAGCLICYTMQVRNG